MNLNNCCVNKQHIVEYIEYDMEHSMAFTEYVRKDTLTNVWPRKG
jgi:hypothetical protein